MNIGIIGRGFVGNAVYMKFKSFFKVKVFDLKNELSNSTYEDLIENCQIIFTCVPTPMNSDGSCNTDNLENILIDLNAKTNAIIANKSTISPGKTEIFNKKFKNIDIIFNPEFLTEKNAITDFNNQNRIILGGSLKSTEIVKNIYQRLFPKSKIICSSSTQAEIVKYFTNCFLATKVSFANEMNDICNVLKVDYDEVIKNVLLDKRIGDSHFNVPGPDGDYGFGGHCLPKDLSAIINLSNKLGTANNVLKSVKITNDNFRSDRDWEKMIGRAVN
jgi:nucleotide sugar dehydrogenase